VPLLCADRRAASPEEARMDENVSVEEFSVETLIEDVSIDGMCGVF
jgi:mycofactocin precursor